MDSGGVIRPFSVTIDGRVWDLYTVEFDTADGKFSTTIYAISTEHAAAIVEEMKATLRLGDKLIEVIRNG